MINLMISQAFFHGIKCPAPMADLSFLCSDSKYGAESRLQPGLAGTRRAPWPAGGCEHVDFDTAAYSINVFAPAG